MDRCRSATRPTAAPAITYRAVSRHPATPAAPRSSAIRSPAPGRSPATARRSSSPATTTDQVSARRSWRPEPVIGGSALRNRRQQLVGHLAEAVGRVTVGHPTRVAVDGPPASGKTTLADDLAVMLRASGREVIRATIDDFLFPRAQRHRRGEYSVEGCYVDTHDCDALEPRSARSARRGRRSTLIGPTSGRFAFLTGA